ARQKAVEAADEARRRGEAERWERYLSNLAAAAGAIQLNNVGAARRALEAAPEEHRNWEWLYFSNQLDGARSTLLGHPSPGVLVPFSPDGHRIVSSSGDGTVRLWDTVTGKELAVLRTRPGAVTALAFSPDGTRVGSRSHGAVHLWETAAGRPVASLGGDDPG